MAKRRLLIGIQTFREVREADCYYVDETPHIGRLLDEGKYYFLSRPRRFGKSHPSGSPMCWRRCTIIRASASRC